MTIKRKSASLKAATKTKAKALKPKLTKRQVMDTLRKQIIEGEVRAMKLYDQLKLKRQKLSELECPFKVGDYLVSQPVGGTEKVYQLKRIRPNIAGHGYYMGLSGVLASGKVSDKVTDVFKSSPFADTLSKTTKPEPPAKKPRPVAKAKALPKAKQ